MIYIVLAVVMFLFALVPGGIIAYFLNKLPLGWGWLVFLSAGAAALSALLVSILLSLKYYGATLEHHAFNVVLMAPFFFLTTLLQLHWLRKAERFGV